MFGLFTGRTKHVISSGYSPRKKGTGAADRYTHAVYACVYMYMCMCASVYMCVRVCVWACVVCVCVCVCVYVRARACVYYMCGT